MREGDWIETEKGKRQWVRRITWGGKRFRWVPCAQSRNRWNFSVDGFEPFSGGCRNGACTGEEVYILRLFYKVEGGGEEKLRWMPVERLKLFSGEAVDVAERDFIASKLEFEGRTAGHRAASSPVPAGRGRGKPVGDHRNPLHLQGRIISQRREFAFSLGVKRKEEDGKPDSGALN